MKDFKTNKTSAWRVIALLLVVILMLFSMASCGSPEPTSNSTNDSGSQEATDDSSSGADEEAKTEFAQNEVVTFNDVDFTVTSVERSAGDVFDTPKEGCEYVIVSLKIENNSDEKISYNEFDWKMENSNGQETDMVFTTINSDTTLGSGDLNPGGVVEGTVAFEEPVGDAGLKLNYYSNSLFDEEAAFKIKID